MKEQYGGKNNSVIALRHLLRNLGLKSVPDEFMIWIAAMQTQALDSYGMPDTLVMDPRSIDALRKLADEKY